MEQAVLTADSPGRPQAFCEGLSFLAILYPFFIGKACLNFKTKTQRNGFSPKLDAPLDKYNNSKNK